MVKQRSIEQNQHEQSNINKHTNNNINSTKIVFSK